MTHRVVRVAVLSAGMLWSAAVAADYDGYDLHMLCSAPVSTPFMLSAGICLGYVTAIAGVLQDAPVDGRRACIPKTVSSDQKQDIVKRWLDRHPEARGLTASRAAVRAFVETYPCNGEIGRRP